MSIEQTIYQPAGALATLAQQGALLKRNLREPIPIESRRIALERMITLDVPHHGVYFAEYSANISMTGMFIKTDRLQSPGTLLTFEFTLADGWCAITGEAEVVWVRKRSRGPDLPAGMGLRFLEIDDESRGLIRRVVEKRMPKGGGQPASGKSAPSAEELEPRTETGSVAEAPLVRPGMEDQAKSRLRSYTEVAIAGSGRVPWKWIFYVVLAGLLGGALLYLYQEPLQRARAASQPAAPEPEPPAESPAATRAVPDLAPVEPVLDMVASWAAAWSAQHADSYLSFYAQTYSPPGDLSLTQWRESRRERISRPDRIEVQITDLEVELLAAERARVRFRQDYASDNYKDSVRKLLELVREDGQWKIQNERVDS